MPHMGQSDEANVSDQAGPDSDRQPPLNFDYGYDDLIPRLYEMMLSFGFRLSVIEDVLRHPKYGMQ